MALFFAFIYKKVLFEFVHTKNASTLKKRGDACANKRTVEFDIVQMLSFMFKKSKIFFAFVQFCTFISWMVVISRKIARRVERVRHIDY